MRFATQPYQPVSLNSNKDFMQNMFVHLTNYALNKENKDFKQPAQSDDDKAHKRNVTSLWKHLDQQGKNAGQVLEATKDVIVKTVLSI